MLGNGGYYKRVEFPTQFAFATLKESSLLYTPEPAYGMIRSQGSNVPITDGVVYLLIEDQKSNTRSGLISSVLSDNGSWYVDLMSATDAAGNPFLRQNSAPWDLDQYIVVEAGEYGRFAKYVQMDRNAPADTIYLGEKSGGQTKYDLMYMGTSVLRSSLPSLSFITLANACPEANTEACITSCEYGCQFSEAPDACRGGCGNACRSMCDTEFQAQASCNSCDGGSGLGATRCGGTNMERCQTDGNNCFWQRVADLCPSEPIQRDEEPEQEKEQERAVQNSPVTTTVCCEREVDIGWGNDERYVETNTNMTSCGNGWRECKKEVATVEEPIVNQAIKATPVIQVCCYVSPGGPSWQNGTICSSGDPLPDSLCPSGTQGTSVVNDNVMNLFLNSLFSRTHAQSGDGTSILFDPETGAYIFDEEGVYRFLYENQLYEVKIENSDANFLIYIDLNNNNQFDPDVDDILAREPVELSFEKVSDIIRYQLSRGFNFISFDFLPESIDPTSEGLLNYLNNEYDNSFFSIAKFDTSSGLWNVMGSREGVTYGNSIFQITPGVGYVLRSSRAINVEVPGYKVENAVPVALSRGWNLIGIHGGSTSYTAQSLLENVRSTGIDADNVSRWESSKSRYDGLQITPDTTGTDQVYGYDYPLYTQQAYFVRVLQEGGRWTPQ